ncbi:hypothetical protein PTTG_07111 [Puccinia triticina 1-1 BBBD Race 1]|uniref:GPI inositol-deacylase n=1 Tax=Puccinia triticina (isolate 1-1 / race 1 (BBBD)) TaxID=630390 RepID=A0A180GAQ9_PUCT1|nr:hypothetical protein PTTG_07111 [Puccinia triticina 1-1 BBBD Race 1]
MDQPGTAQPILSTPLSAVLRAGGLSPGTRYSPSPTVKSLRRILEQQDQKTRLPPLERIRLINSQYSLLFNTAQHTVHSRDSSAESSVIPLAEPVPEQPDTPTTAASRIRRWFRLTRTQDDNSIQPGPRSATAELQSIISYSNTDPAPFTKPKFPLVLCHGLLGFDVLGPAALGLSYFRGVREALEERGVEVHVAKVPACASIEERAKTLAQFIESRLAGRTVNLIGHSMGGLDSRFLITHLQPTSFKVASLTTIGTPHRGSAFADYLLLDVLGRQHLPTFLQISKTLGLPGGGQAFVELTSEQMAAFNKTTPDVEGTAYFSYGATCEPSFASPFRPPWGVVFEREGPNDGLVSVASAQWGTYLGTLRNVNHAELVGWVEPWRTSKKQLATLVPLHSDDAHHQDQQCHQHHQTDQFQVVPFYLQVVDSLAKKGF